MSQTRSKFSLETRGCRFYFALRFLVVPAMLLPQVGSLHSQPLNCEVCAKSLELSSIEAKCFLSLKDELIEDGRLSEPVLVDFGICASEETTNQSEDLSLRGTVELPNGPGCVTGRCSSTLFAFLLVDQLICLADLLEDTSFFGDVRTKINFEDCENVEWKKDG